MIERRFLTLTDQPKVWGGSACQGPGALIHEIAPNAQNRTDRRYRREGMVDRQKRAKRRTRSSVRA
jgi:hypothetical protein